MVFRIFPLILHPAIGLDLPWAAFENRISKKCKKRLQRYPLKNTKRRLVAAPCSLVQRGKGGLCSLEPQPSAKVEKNHIFNLLGFPPESPTLHLTDPLAKCCKLVPHSKITLNTCPGGTCVSSVEGLFPTMDVSAKHSQRSLSDCWTNDAGSRGTHTQDAWINTVELCAPPRSLAPRQRCHRNETPGETSKNQFVISKNSQGSKFGHQNKDPWWFLHREVLNP